MTQTDLQSKKDDSNQASDGIIQPPPYIQQLIEKTVKFVVLKHNGSDFELKRMILTRTIQDPRFKFLRSSHKYHAFYHQKLNGYHPPKQDGQTTQVRRTRVPSSPPPVQPEEILQKEVQPEGISQKEVAIIDLTAQFAARYGLYFLLDLSKANKDDFAFSKPKHWHYGFYKGLIEKHARILEQAPYGKSIMDGFLKLVISRKEGEEASVDWINFEATYFRNKENTNPFLVLGPMFDNVNYQIPMHYHQMVLPLIESLQQEFSPPQPEEPDLVVGLVPEEEFLAQYQVPLTITVFVPIQSDFDFKWKGRDFKVPSLSESVRSFKEKIAEEIKVPASKLKLIVGDGDAGFLKENKSLAYYNVGVGPKGILSLSIRL